MNFKTEQEVRNYIISIQNGYIGCKTGDARHHDIVDTYNAHTPLPRGYKVKYTDSWCATDVSAVAIKAGMDSIIPLECGCGEMVKLAKNMKIWKARTYVPKKGDIIMYDFKGPDGWADHTGYVESLEKVEDSLYFIHTIEGNANGGVCGRRSIMSNDKKILGFIAPNYKSMVTPDPPKPKQKIGIVTTDVNLRTSPINLGFINKCKVDRNDGKGIRSVLDKGENAPIISESGNWYQLEIKGAVYTWTPWATKSAIKVVE